MTKRKAITFGVLLFLEVFLLATRWGFISNGALSITILYIPIIIGTLYLGMAPGVLMSVVFGIGTMIVAEHYGLNTLDRLFVYPQISVLPRLLLPMVSRIVYCASKRETDDGTFSSEIIASSLAAFASTIVTTLSVLTSLCLFFPTEMGITKRIVSVGGVLMNTIGANMTFELIVTVTVSTAVMLLLRKGELRWREREDAPLRITFQKWLVLVINGAVLLSLVVSYGLQSIYERQSTEAYMDVALSQLSARIEQIEETEQIKKLPLQIGKRGIIIISKDGMVLNSNNESLRQQPLTDLGLNQVSMTKINTVTLSGQTYLCKAVSKAPYKILVMMSDAETFKVRNATAVMMLLVNCALFVIVYLLISRLLKKYVVKKIYRINNALSNIQGGNLNEVVNVSGNKEFIVLSDGINATVKALKETMQEVAQRMRQEMEFARVIQCSVLPLPEHVIPAHHEYEILGTMEAAKEVGGDFFDYFMIDDHRLGIAIADVSGKGVPAALFMMTAKTLIKNFTLSGGSPGQTLSLANEQLCENNEAGMFVTVWLGILDYETGVLTFANGGHNPPLLRKDGEAFAYLDQKMYKRSLVLGVSEGVPYRNNQITLQKGDSLFLYTDGAVEADNVHKELFGEARLKASLDAYTDLAPAELLRSVRKDIDAFAGEAEQFDDITMVVLKYHGKG